MDGWRHVHEWLRQIQTVSTFHFVYFLLRNKNKFNLILWLTHSTFRIIFIHSDIAPHSISFIIYNIEILILILIPDRGLGLHRVAAKKEKEKKTKNHRKKEIGMMKVEAKMI